MKYRDFGSTGVQISEIVFGAGAQGGIVFQGERETRLEAVRRALDYGINWIDTAAQYGDGQSEENLGWVLKELGANPLCRSLSKAETTPSSPSTSSMEMESLNVPRARVTVECK